MQPTIFIIIARSFITRNLLRFGTLDLLKQAGYKVVIFFYAPKITDYITEEFAGENIKLVALPLGPRSWLHRFLVRQSVYLIATNTARMLVFYKERIKKHLTFKKVPILAAVSSRVRLLLLAIISRLHFLKFFYSDIYILNIFRRLIKKSNHILIPTSQPWFWPLPLIRGWIWRF